MTDNSFMIGHLNINGLLSTYDDFILDEQMSKADILCISETHLNESDEFPALPIHEHSDKTA